MLLASAKSSKFSNCHLYGEHLLLGECQQLPPQGNSAGSAERDKET
jgi:hypothetical protein